MDDCQIPTIDGRHITLRYDEETRQVLLIFPPAEDEDAETNSFGFTAEGAEHFVAELAAIRAQMAGGASPG